MDKIIKFAVIGFGHIGRRHATIISEYPGAKLVSIIDSDPDAFIHSLYPEGVTLFPSLEEFLTSGPTVDAICIATPNNSHCSHALLALEHGLHVIIEKPMGLSREQCEQVLYRSLKMSRHVFVVKQNRYSPPSRWMKEVVSNKTIGNVFMVQINCYWNRDDRYYIPSQWKGTIAQDGGTLFTQFSHFIDIMYWVFGDIKDIHSTFADFSHQDLTEFEDSGLVQFSFINGGIGSINFSTALYDKNMESSITVIGSKGSFKIGGQYMNEIEYCHIKDYELPELEQTNPPNDYGPFKGSAANHHYVIENVVNTLKGEDTITVNALEGMKVVDIIERIYASRDLSKLKSSDHEYKLLYT
ncbi:MAG: Gfo/Idh/MocA family oxidoreductase [Sphingobacteriaceae bacterium]|nr:MAG: Gfo/Idh/MocA family oxidoreductase [Sphingobacteriaceae bacterium]